MGIYQLRQVMIIKISGQAMLRSLTHCTLRMLCITHPPKKHPFRFKLQHLQRSQFFMKIISQPHELPQTNRILNSILCGTCGLNRHNFETVFSKYCFYVQKVAKESTFEQAPLGERLRFLDLVTRIYSSYGQLRGVHMTKAMNRTSELLYNAYANDVEKGEGDDVAEGLVGLLTVITAVSRYNKPRAISMYKRVEKVLLDYKVLSKIDVRVALVYMQLMANMLINNRLIVQNCIDALFQDIMSISKQDLLKVLRGLSSCAFAINKKFVLRIIKRVDKQFDKTIDPSSGLPKSKNVQMVRQQLKIFNSLSLLEVNLKLASAYLPELNKLYEIQLFDIGTRYLNRMSDTDLTKYCSFLRRAHFYDESLLSRLVLQLMRRDVKELRPLRNSHNGLQDDDGEEAGSKQQTQYNEISLNTLCTAVHTLAVLNYRDQPFITYFVNLVDILNKSEQVRLQKSPSVHYQQQSGQVLDPQSQPANQTNFQTLIRPKHFSRVVWSLCVLATKQQISLVYSIFHNFFLRQQDDLPLHELTNYYYCYLLLKAYFPRNKFSFDKLFANLESKHMVSSISLTHQAIYQNILQADIAALKQHNVSNIMCDIFVPMYISKDRSMKLENLVIDVHGPHHFMRNCQKLTGGGVLKGKILRNEGYVYHYLDISEWELVHDPKDYIHQIMEALAAKYGKPMDSEQHRSITGKKQSLIPIGKADAIREIGDIGKAEDTDEQTSRLEGVGRRRRSIRTNSLRLDSQLNKKQQQ